MTYPMLDLLTEGVIAFGPERQVYYCNDAFLDIFEIGRGRLFSGRPFYEFVTFSDKKIFLMPNGNDGEDDVMRYRLVQYETHLGAKGEVQVAITPTRETFAKSTLWFAYFYKSATKDALTKASVEMSTIVEKCKSLNHQDLAVELASLKEKIDQIT